MNLLTSELPLAVHDIGGDLLFDFESSGVPTRIHDIAWDYKTILELMGIFKNEKYIEQERIWIALRIFFLGDVPDDVTKAAQLMNRFVDCDTDWAQSSANIRIYDWEQDGNYIYTGMNQCHGNILIHEPNLHWWPFVGFFMDMHGECQFGDILSNRQAHRTGKATKEQKEARLRHPEIYILRGTRKSDDDTINRAKELEKLMNAKQ